MQIDKLVIFGFGKHENVTIELGASVNVLYGHNEAGKTTIQQFILHTLFGFPPRNSMLLRYEPKSGGKYGGRIYLKDSIYGNCIVERVRGKSAGDVKVYFENGEVGEQEALEKLLRQYDRAAFESIFSFSLLQLQGFEKMNEQELSRTLLASGTTGVDHLLQIEQTMEKEMDGMFKKQGRNPVLNKKLTELRNIEEALERELRKANEYAPAVERLQEIEEVLATIQVKIGTAERRYRELSIQKQQLPLIKKRATLQSRLQALKGNHFPTDGLLRYESIVNKLDEAKASVVSLQQEVKQIEQQNEKAFDESKLHRLQQLLGEEAHWHRSLSTLYTLKEQRTQLIAQTQRLQARLGSNAQEETSVLLHADVSLRKEEDLYELLENLQQYHREIELMENEQKRLQEEQRQIIDREQQLIPPSKQVMEQAERWPKIQQQIAEAKAYIMMNQQQQSNGKMMLLGLLLFMILIAGYGIISKQYNLLGFAMIGFIVGFVWLKRQQPDEKITEMEATLIKYEGTEEQIAETIERIRVYENEKEIHEERKQNINIALQRATATYEKLEQKVNEQEQNLQLFLAQYGIDGLPSAHVIPELFRMIREVQEHMQELATINQEIPVLKETIQKHQHKSEQIIQQSIPTEALYERIRREYQLFMEHAQERESNVKKKRELEQIQQEKEALVTIYKTQLEQLFEEAQVKSEEAYYQANKIDQEKAVIQQQLDHLAMQLTTYPVNNSILTEAQLENMMEETTDSLTAMRRKQDLLVEEKAVLFNKTNTLLKDDKLSRLQQQFEVECARFNILAKQWASKKALATAIQQMMNDLKEKKLPYVLKEASGFFDKLTGGRYEALVLTDDKYFEVITSTGTHFPIVELSQATKEQAYISLRLALALSLVETAPFPIIMDDPFVHFDKQRQSHIIEVLDHLSTHQIIYFTCHEEMSSQWSKATTINVSTIGNE